MKMCEYCRSQKIVSVGLEKGQKHRCQWDEYYERQQPYQPDTTKVIVANCVEPATQRVRNRHIIAHLCAADKFRSEKEYKRMREREPDLDESREYLPIQSSGFRCEAIVQIRGLYQSREPGDNGILSCGKPATQLETHWEEMYFCDEHARAYKAAEEAENIVDLQHGRFLYNNNIMPNNQVICARKGCGKTAEGNLAHLPVGWRVILVAPGSIFKLANQVQANWGGALCPEHATEVNNLLIDLPANSFNE
jgi:hypothetical protein